MIKRDLKENKWKEYSYHCCCCLLLVGAPATRERLALQLETLIEAVEHISREYAASAADRISPVAPVWGKLYVVPRRPA